MKKYLYMKFILAIILLGLLGFSAISLAGSKLMQKHVEAVYSEELYREASHIAQDPLIRSYQTIDDQTDVYNDLCTLSTYQNASIWLISTKGEILLDTSSAFVKEDFPVITGFNPGQTSGSYYQTGLFFHQFKEEHLSVMVPVTLNMHVQGYVTMHLPMTALYEQRDELLNILYLLFFLFLLIMLAIIPVFSLTIYRPLRTIIQGADAFASGNLEYNIPLEKEDEMGYLAMTLNYMSDELEMTGNYQKKFIANVSHDFRSPLTSIKGYLEAIIDGTIPPEMYEKYLTRVISETDRLTKLTQGMLTLNSLDSKGYLSRTNFDINRVIKDTAASFEGTCATKNIVFELTFSDTIQMVYGDLGKIQQVLYNLIDNAIKFSHADSVIYIQAYAKNEKVFISVKDTGEGIPKESIKKIWERFYKSDQSRGKDKKGTGLGLAIVKEIIQAHGENIDVISTEGVGSEFIFSLPRSTSL